MPGDRETFAQLGFRFPWRPYQARVLSAIDRHLSDDRLHIVAAPGSGKTILGLETFRRLGRAAIVFAPTITIRDQWLARLSLFLPENNDCTPAWASSSLDAPGLLTCVTYQALHAKVRQAESAALREDPDENHDDESEAPALDAIQRLVRALRERDVHTIILDEAHHLRREWWNALERIAHALDDVTLVSLTATPPYDVVGTEWQRYESLCGPIDEEISVPELVKSGTLAPHQDYVWAVAPDEQVRQLTRDYANAVESVTKELECDGVLIDAVQRHPWMTDAPAHVRDILEAPESAVAMLVLLQDSGRSTPSNVKALIAPGSDSLPSLSIHWWQVLIQSYLFDNHWPDDEATQKHRAALAGRLRAIGLLHRRELRFESSRPLRDRIAMSSAKTFACLDIHSMERDVRGDQLRQVILTDYIRDDAPTGGNAAQLGAWPVFHELASSAEPSHQSQLALLTGRLALIHAKKADSLTAIFGNDAEAVQMQPFPMLPGFVRVMTSRNDLLVPAFTRLFTEGGIDTIVGTRALLGEGWDAPSINSLILASYVGTYVTTNQMRGRAIRRDPQQPDKAASIWHLVAVDNENEAGMQDAWTLSERFSAFVGLHATRPVIESGVARMELPEPWSDRFIEHTNSEMRERLRRTNALAERWRTAIDQGTEGRVIPTVQSAVRVVSRKLLVTNTLARLFAASAAAAVGPLQYWLNWLVRSGGASAGTLAKTFAAAASVALLFMMPGLYRAIRTMIRFYPVDGALRQIGLALRAALVETKHLDDPAGTTNLIVRTHANGTVSVALAGATFHESSVFADCLREILGPIENPRYLIVRRGSRWFGQRFDVHAVPTILGERKELASAFFRAWRRHVGRAKLIYTRNAAGRETLLRARVLAFSSTDDSQTRRFDQWQ